jgi:hypothetical protein
MFSRQKRILVCEITATQVLAVEVVIERQQAVVQANFQIDSSEYDKDTKLPTPERLQRAISEAGIRTNQAIVLLPQSTVRQFRMQVPSMSADEFCEIARLHAEAELPDIDKMTIDHYPVESADDEQVTLMLCCVATQIVEGIKNLFLASGLVCQTVTLESGGWRGAISRHSMNQSRAIVIVPRQDTLEVVVFRNQCLVSHRVRRLSVSDPESTAPDRFVGELRRCRMALASFLDANETCDVILLGTEDKWSALNEQIKVEFSANVSVVAPDELVTWPRSAIPVDLDAYKSLATASASIVNQDRPSINFVKPSKPGNYQQRKLWWAVGGAVATLLIFTAMSVWSTRMATERQARLNLLHAQQDKLAAQLQQLAGAEHLARVFEERREKQVDWIRTLNKLRKHFPDNKRCYLAHVVFTTPEEEGPSRIQGQLLADGTPSILKINRNILNRGQFELQPRGALHSLQDKKYPIRVDLEATLKSVKSKFPSHTQDLISPVSPRLPGESAAVDRTIPARPEQVEEAS